jgi:hypothetical protein
MNQPNPNMTKDPLRRGSKKELLACYSTLYPAAASTGKHNTNEGRKTETSKNGVIIQSFESEEVEMRLKDDVKVLFISCSLILIHLPNFHFKAHLIFNKRHQLSQRAPLPHCQ